MNRRTTTLLLAALALVAVWAVAFGGFTFARKQKGTAEKVMAFMDQNDLRKAAAGERERLMRELADRLNRLPYEERRNVRVNGDWARWFDAMSEQEKARFLEATMPTGFKQAITAFEQLPEPKRKKTMDDAFKRLREAQQTDRRPVAPDGGTNPPVALSEELRQKVTTIGLNTFLKESTPQTRAEVMPLLEEMQRTMQRGTSYR